MNDANISKPLNATNLSVKGDLHALKDRRECGQSKRKRRKSETKKESQTLMFLKRFPDIVFLRIKRKAKLMDIFLTLLTKLNRDRKGVTALEYGLIASLIAVVIITSVKLVGTNLSTTFNTVAGHFTGGTVK